MFFVIFRLRIGVEWRPSVARESPVFFRCQSDNSNRSDQFKTRNILPAFSSPSNAKGGHRRTSRSSFTPASISTELKSIEEREWFDHRVESLVSSTQCEKVFHFSDRINDSDKYPVFRTLWNLSDVSMQTTIDLFDRPVKDPINSSQSNEQNFTQGLFLAIRCQSRRRRSKWRCFLLKMNVATRRQTSTDIDVKNCFVFVTTSNLIESIQSVNRQKRRNYDWIRIAPKEARLARHFVDNSSWRHLMKSSALGWSSSSVWR